MTHYPKRQSQYNINLWIVPLKMSAGAVLLFGLTMIPDLLAAYHKIQIPTWFSMGSIDDARAILGAMLGCVSTVLALIFSVALLVLSMVANLFGPRLLYRFVQDWVTQATIGLFMAAFIYVFLAFLVTHSDQSGTFIPQVTLITSWFLVLTAFSFLVYYSHRVAASIQNPDAIARIVDDLRRAVEHASANALGKPSNPSRQLTDDSLSLTAKSRIIASHASGYLQEIHHDALLTTAARANTVLHLHFRPGQFVLQGEHLATVLGNATDRNFESLVKQSVIIGRHRILTQDLEFGVAQIVEIAIRALSPAINDTFTGIACTDLLGEALMILAAGARQDGRWYDADGYLRLQVRPLCVPRLVKQAFDQVRQAAADNPAVLIRLLSTIGRLWHRLEQEDERSALMEQADAVLETGLSRNPIKLDREDIQAAWQKTHDLFLALAASPIPSNPA